MSGGIVDLLRRPSVVRVAQVAIGAIFVAAALAKIPDLPTFAKQVAAYDLAPTALVHLVAMTLPWVEVVAGLALILGVRPRAGGVVALLSMAFFTAAVASAWSRGLSIDCGCFGKALPEPIGLGKVLENLVMTALAAIAVLRPKSI